MNKCIVNVVHVNGPPERSDWAAGSPSPSTWSCPASRHTQRLAREDSRLGLDIHRSTSCPRKHSHVTLNHTRACFPLSQHDGSCLAWSLSYHFYCVSTKLHSPRGASALKCVTGERKPNAGDVSVCMCAADEWCWWCLPSEIRDGDGISR